MGLTVKKLHRAVVWIRREYRLDDHLALWSAAHDAEEVLPLVIVGDDFDRGSHAKRAAIREAMSVLRERLRGIGGELFVRRGEAADVLPRFMEKAGCTAVYLTSDPDPVIHSGDVLLRSRIEGAGRLWKEFEDHVLFGAADVRTTGSGEPYTVFTPYRNAWRLRRSEIPPPLSALRSLRSPQLPPGELPGQGIHTKKLDILSPVISGGEMGALQMMRLFLAKGVMSYDRHRDLLAVPGTSRLSHHLALGMLGVRTLYAAILECERATRGVNRRGIEAFLDQLIWREFYYQILANFPTVANSSFRPFFDSVPWKERPEMWAAWQEGRTGYPIVDAAMRQLAQEGWMHNRGRMIVASFLTKDLRIHWKRGEEYFMRQLVDGDTALNNGGWQWSAGSGTDAQPWFRIFNPVLQGKKFDPTGAYVRRYVPELGRVPDWYIHDPWLMPPDAQRKSGCLIGRDYPGPIVDHEIQRRETIRVFGEARVVPTQTPRKGTHARTKGTLHTTHK